MRSWMLISLLLLSILVHEAQGIRIRKGSLPERQNNKHQEIHQGERNNDSVEEAIIVCKGKKCSGRVRKLIMSLISTTSTIAKNDHKNDENKSHPKLEGSSTNEKLGRKEENLSVNSSSITEQGQPKPETYPDILDIAGMDYSQARRKPPIHN
ncbi:hypothetical protein BUALT_Bualt16G0079100 [Buddleja alternifolia]|uniref:Uncharacterized protein n=1 Tax=Buddleja alternifolia TaxID=168488 RepID=A0AAV6WGA3_9LAMI|nr:hypothetical protein BUALT_Bualt16G0079100 [Buddleja alternifolia]